MPRTPVELLIRTLKRIVEAFPSSDVSSLVNAAVEDFEKDTEAAKKPRKGKEL